MGCLSRQSSFQGGDVLNRAFIERLQGTFWERLASRTCKSRQAAVRLQTDMYLIGCTYNFCVVYQEVSKAKHWGAGYTAAMALGLTDHRGSFGGLLSYQVGFAPWIEPKRGGRPPLPHAARIKGKRCLSRSRPLGRLRKGILCSSSG